jgi:mannose-6-phosphate isomerase-like protein (cupin superfamily)
MALREFKREPEPSMEHRSFQKPDERREFSLGKVEVVSLGGVTFGRATFEPGWRWSTCVKPIAKTESCEVPHLNFHVSGRLHVVMDDGSEAEFGPGDVSEIPPGHDAWVVGNEPAIVVDITGMGNYAKGK